SAGPGQMAFDFINESGKAVEALTLPLADWTVRPERIFAERDDIHCVIDDDSVRIYDDPPKPRLMEPGERRGIVILFAGPLAPDQEFKFPVRADLIAGECYPDCDGDGKLDIFDFLCFQNAFAAGELQADCDGDGALDIFDFLCFQNEFGAGCP
ncbi:MAG: GC-type dockerin domain-anchored protein, partial [Phycisphaerales bacterium JB039]